MSTWENNVQQNVIEDASSEEYDTWIGNFCSLFGHDFFVEVSPDFIEDDFNLTGLSSLVPKYREALDLILDYESDPPVSASDAPFVEHSAEVLYGLIHARYILTKEGLNGMAEKYENGKFGVCPRYRCNGMLLLPVGRYDHPGMETVRMYCPSCCDIYFPSSSRYLNLDGAFFGTTFPGLFITTFKEVENQAKLHQVNEPFDLKLFGFKLSVYGKCGPRMKWLRQFPKTEQEKKEFEKCRFRTPALNELKDSDEGGHAAEDGETADDEVEDEDEPEQEEDAGIKSSKSVKDEDVAMKSQDESVVMA